MNINDLDLYEDLDEFHEQEQKKSSELLQLEDKYKDALATNDQLREEMKKLRKQQKTIEVNFQNLLDTAKAELKRKDQQITLLRKEKDDICFRRKLPNHFVNRDTQQHNPFKQQQYVPVKPEYGEYPYNSQRLQPEPAIVSNAPAKIKEESLIATTSAAAAVSHRQHKKRQCSPVAVVDNEQQPHQQHLNKRVCLEESKRNYDKFINTNDSQNLTNSRLVVDDRAARDSTRSVRDARFSQHHSHDTPKSRITAEVYSDSPDSRDAKDNSKRDPREERNSHKSRSHDVRVDSQDARASSRHLRDASCNARDSSSNLKDSSRDTKHYSHGTRDSISSAKAPLKETASHVDRDHHIQRDSRDPRDPRDSRDSRYRRDKSEHRRNNDADDRTVYSRVRSNQRSDSEHERDPRKNSRSDRAKYDRERGEDHEKHNNRHKKESSNSDEISRKYASKPLEKYANHSKVHSPDDDVYVKQLKPWPTQATLDANRAEKVEETKIKQDKIKTDIKNKLNTLNCTKSTVVATQLENPKEQQLPNLGNITTNSKEIFKEKTTTNCSVNETKPLSTKILENVNVAKKNTEVSNEENAKTTVILTPVKANDCGILKMTAQNSDVPKSAHIDNTNAPNTVDKNTDIQNTDVEKTANVLNTPKKVALFNALFGTSPAGNKEDATQSKTNSKLLTNVLQILSNNSSATTSPSVYSDVGVVANDDLKPGAATITSQQVESYFKANPKLETVAISNIKNASESQTTTSLIKEKKKISLETYLKDKPKLLTTSPKTNLVEKLIADLSKNQEIVIEKMHRATDSKTAISPAKNDVAEQIFGNVFENPVPEKKKISDVQDIQKNLEIDASKSLQDIQLNEIVTEDKLSRVSEEKDTSSTQENVKLMVNVPERETLPAEYAEKTRHTKTCDVIEIDLDTDEENIREMQHKEMEEMIIKELHVPEHKTKKPVIEIIEDIRLPTVLPINQMLKTLAVDKQLELSLRELTKHPEVVQIPNIVEELTLKTIVIDLEDDDDDEGAVEVNLKDVERNAAIHEQEEDTEEDKESEVLDDTLERILDGDLSENEDNEVVNVLVDGNRNLDENCMDALDDTLERISKKYPRAYEESEAAVVPLDDESDNMQQNSEEISKKEAGTNPTHMLTDTKQQHIKEEKLEQKLRELTNQKEVAQKLHIVETASLESIVIGLDDDDEDDQLDKKDNKKNAEILEQEQVDVAENEELDEFVETPAQQSIIIELEDDEDDQIDMESDRNSAEMKEQEEDDDVAEDEELDELDDTLERISEKDLIENEGNEAVEVLENINEYLKHTGDEVETKPNNDCQEVSRNEILNFKENHVGVKNKQTDEAIEKNNVYDVDENVDDEILKVNNATENLVVEKIVESEDEKLNVLFNVIEVNNADTTNTSKDKFTEKNEPNEEKITNEEKNADEVENNEKMHTTDEAYQYIDEDRKETNEKIANTINTTVTIADEKITDVLKTDNKNVELIDSKSADVIANTYEKIKEDEKEEKNSDKHEKKKVVIEMLIEMMADKEDELKSFDENKTYEDNLTDIQKKSENEIPTHEEKNTTKYDTDEIKSKEEQMEYIDDLESQVFSNLECIPKENKKKTHANDEHIENKLHENDEEYTKSSDIDDALEKIFGDDNEENDEESDSINVNLEWNSDETTNILSGDDVSLNQQLIDGEKTNENNNTLHAKMGNEKDINIFETTIGQEQIQHTSQSVINATEVGKDISNIAADTECINEFNKDTENADESMIIDEKLQNVIGFYVSNVLKKVSNEKDNDEDVADKMANILHKKAEDVKNVEETRTVEVQEEIETKLLEKNTTDNQNISHDENGNSKVLNKENKLENCGEISLEKNDEEKTVTENNTLETNFTMQMENNDPTNDEVYKNYDGTKAFDVCQKKNCSEQEQKYDEKPKYAGKIDEKEILERSQKHKDDKNMNDTRKTNESAKKHKSFENNTVAKVKHYDGLTEHDQDMDEEGNRKEVLNIVENQMDIEKQKIIDEKKEEKLKNVTEKTKVKKHNDEMVKIDENEENEYERKKLTQDLCIPKVQTDELNLKDVFVETVELCEKRDKNEEKRIEISRRKSTPSNKEKCYIKYDNEDQHNINKTTIKTNEQEMELLNSSTTINTNLHTQEDGVSFLMQTHAPPETMSDHRGTIKKTPTKLKDFLKIDVTPIPKATQKRKRKVDEVKSEKDQKKTEKKISEEYFPMTCISEGNQDVKSTIKEQLETKTNKGLINVEKHDDKMSAIYKKQHQKINKFSKKRRDSCFKDVESKTCQLKKPETKDHEMMMNLEAKKHEIKQPEIMAQKQIHLEKKDVLENQQIGKPMEMEHAMHHLLKDQHKVIENQKKVQQIKDHHFIDHSKIDNQKNDLSIIAHQKKAQKTNDEQDMNHELMEQNAKNQKKIEDVRKEIELKLHKLKTDDLKDNMLKHKEKANIAKRHRTISKTNNAKHVIKTKNSLPKSKPPPRRKSQNILRIVDSDSDDDDAVYEAPSAQTTNEITKNSINTQTSALDEKCTKEMPKAKRRRIQIKHFTHIDDGNSKCTKATNVQSAAEPFNISAPSYGTPVIATSPATADHAIFHTDAVAFSTSAESLLPNYHNMLQDHQYKDIDSRLQSMFQSPPYEIDATTTAAATSFELPMHADDVNNYSPVHDTYIEPTFDDVPLAEAVDAIDETPNMSSFQSTTTSSPPASTSAAIAIAEQSSCCDTSLETKNLSLGNSSYRLAQVNEHVVNVFITRKRHKKRTSRAASEAPTDTTIGVNAVVP